MRLTTPPPDLPNSAVGTEVMTRNSWIESTVGMASNVMPEPTSVLLTPSTRKLIELRRVPLMEKFTTFVNPMPISEEPSLLTPGTRLSNDMKLRLLSGNSTTRRFSTTSPTVGLTWIKGASAVTVTDSVTAPVSSGTLIVLRSPTLSSMLLLRYSLNPSARIDKSYIPGCICVMV